MCSRVAQPQTVPEYLAEPVRKADHLKAPITVTFYDRVSDEHSLSAFRQPAHCPASETTAVERDNLSTVRDDFS